MERDHPSYLFHWLPIQKLGRFARSGILKPAWKHFILDDERLATGTSTCEEPMLWNPDEGLPREPCLILDYSKIDAGIRLINSSEAYHLTKRIANARRAGKDIAPLVEQARRMRAFSHGGWDEHFVEGPITVGAVIGIGIEEDDVHGEEYADAVRAVAQDLSLPTLDMTGWEVGMPGLAAVDELVREMLSERTFPVPA